jgi:DNA-binding NarL/FixJ family response regulator
MQVKILLVDDHTILRQGLRQLLALEPRFEVVDEASNGEEAVYKTLMHKPDIILMDVNLPKINGYEASRAILTTWPEARILVLSNQDEGQIIKKFIDLGVKGYMLKDAQIELLTDTIFKIVEGHSVPLSEELEARKKQVEQNTQQKSNHYFSLTEREREVLTALAKGFSNQTLADLLCVSPKTVHNHLYNIYSKIGVKTRAEAIVWAMDSGFLEGLS